MALTSSPEQPLPVRTVAKAIGDWVGRLGRVWVEGQVTQVTRRPGAATAFLTLRDPHADLSLQVTCSQRVCEAVVPPLAEGARVIVHARPELWLARGSLSLAATEIRPVGVGELLARLERLKGVLAAEGLFAAERKRPLPFLPRVVGLVTGRASAAERDVLDNARRRWPAVRFRVENVAVQGLSAVTQVCDALRVLDRDPEVDVIVIARGGGSIEDLLPFSDEGLCRQVAASRTPVVSAVGHEQDTPLLDFVADVRASTPTDAAKRVVPDLTEQRRLVQDLHDRARRAVTGRLDREDARVRALVSRPVLADPTTFVTARADVVHALRQRARRTFGHRLDAAGADLAHTRARVAALGPAATLQRGYAVVQTATGAVLRDPAEVAPGAALRLRLAAGDLAAVAGDGAPR